MAHNPACPSNYSLLGELIGVNRKANMLYCYMQIHAEYILTQWIKTSEDFFKKYTAHFIWKGCVCEWELETEQNCNILSPALMAISVVSFSFSWCSTRGPGAQISAGLLYHILSPTHLISNSWLPIITVLYNNSIAHSIFGMAGLIVIKRK